MYSHSSSLFSNPYLLLTLATLFWGGNVIAGKLAASEMSSIEFTFYRWLIATIVLLPFAWWPIKKDWENIKQHGLLLFTFGALGFTGFTLMMYWALHYTTAVNVAIEQAATPLLIFFISIVFLTNVAEFPIHNR